MLELLANGRIYKTKELSELLEVKSRMIRQYKDELEKAGIYISSIKGPMGGYYIDYDYNHPIRGITKDELKYLKKIDDKFVAEIANKLENFIVKEVEIIHRELYNKLSECIVNSIKIKITYKSSKGSIRKRIIHPTAIYNNQGVWRVLAYCEYKKNLRRFRLDAILNYEITNDYF